MTVTVEGPGIPGRRHVYPGARSWKVDAGTLLLETGELGQWFGYAPGVWSTFHVS